jgi:lysophospholipase L1-like esterase
MEDAMRTDSSWGRARRGALGALLAAWAAAPLPAACAVGLQGIVNAGPHASASRLSIHDVNGITRVATADAAGRYRADAAGLKAPLLVVAQGPGKQLLALVPALAGSGTTMVNVNVLTDKISSDVATDPALKLGFSGPEDLARARRAPAAATGGVVAAKTRALRTLLQPALLGAGVPDVQGFDPLRTRSSAEQAALEALLALVKHNRGFDVQTGKRGPTVLFDPYMHPITRYYAGEKIDFAVWKRQAAEIANASLVRIFVAGDSTVSNHDRLLFPRTGWGQFLGERLSDPARTKVVNVAQSGRSSRSFVAEGWLTMIEQEIRPGDLLLIQFGHNDERCAGAVEVATLCSYPNTAQGAIQGGSTMSFQRSLEKYVAVARSKGATPVLITPVTRVVKDRNDPGKGVFPIVGTTHVSRQGAFRGDYSQTVRDAARANGTALIDLDAQSIAFANRIGDPGWKQYWLAVHEAQYPRYAPGVTGNFDTPDNVHFQQAGARVLADMVVQGIRADRTGSLDELLPLFLN